MGVTILIRGRMRSGMVTGPIRPRLHDPFRLVSQHTETTPFRTATARPECACCAGLRDQRVQKRSFCLAAACGRPMVLSNIRGCREIGGHEVELLLSPPQNPTALEQAVRRLLRDRDLRDRLGAAAKVRAHRKFDQRAIAATSWSTYVWALGRRKSAT